MSVSFRPAGEILKNNTDSDILSAAGFDLPAPASTGRYYFHYDSLGSVVAPSDSTANSVATYTYDYLGRRISKNVGGNITKYCYDGPQVIAEYNGSDTLQRRFYYGPGIDEPICMQKYGDGAGLYYYHYDGLGSVTALSNSNSDIVERYSYDVFGQPTIYDANGTVITQSAYGNPYMFTARRLDPETDNYYYRARYYNPEIGRFLQTDPIDYADGLNMYTYVHNNPINYTDPSGLWNFGFGGGWGIAGQVKIGHNGGVTTVSLSVGLGAGGYATVDSINTGTPATGSNSWGLHGELTGVGGVIGGVGMSGEMGGNLTAGNVRSGLGGHASGSIGPISGTAQGSVTGLNNGALFDSGTWNADGGVYPGLAGGAGAFGFLGGGVDFTYGTGNGLYDSLYELGSKLGEWLDSPKKECK